LNQVANNLIQRTMAGPFRLAAERHFSSKLIGLAPAVNP